MVLALMAILTILTAIITIELYSSTQFHTIVDSTFFSSLKLEKIAPQGWGFFTRPPREEQTIFYRSSDGVNFELISFPNSSCKNFYGLSKASRRLMNEEGLMASNYISDFHSSKIKSVSINEINGEDLQLDTLNIKKNDFNFIYFHEGEYYIAIRYRTYPWSWYLSVNKKKKRYKIMASKFVIRCE